MPDLFVGERFETAIPRHLAPETLKFADGLANLR
jgi:hypothetical protein